MANNVTATIADHYTAYRRYSSQYTITVRITHHIYPKFLRVNREARRVALRFYRAAIPVRVKDRFDPPPSDLEERQLCNGRFDPPIKTEAVLYLNPDRDFLRLITTFRMPEVFRAPWWDVPPLLLFLHDLRTKWDPLGAGLRNWFVRPSDLGEISSEGFRWLQLMKYDHREHEEGRSEEEARQWARELAKSFVATIDGLRNLVRFEYVHARIRPIDLWEGWLDAGPDPMRVEECYAGTCPGDDSVPCAKSQTEADGVAAVADKLLARGSRRVIRRQARWVVRDIQFNLEEARQIYVRDFIGFGKLRRAQPHWEEEEENTADDSSDPSRRSIALIVKSSALRQPVRLEPAPRDSTEFLGWYRDHVLKIWGGTTPLSAAPERPVTPPASAGNTPEEWVFVGFVSPEEISQWI